MNFFKKKQQAVITSPEIEKLKTEIVTETTYLSKLISKYYNDPKNEWKLNRLSRRPNLYLSGKIERVKDDNDYTRYSGAGMNDNRHFLKDPALAEIRETERRIKNLQLKIRSLSLYEGIRDNKITEHDILYGMHPENCDCDDCYGEEE